MTGIQACDEGIPPHIEGTTEAGQGPRAFKRKEAKLMRHLVADTGAEMPVLCRDVTNEGGPHHPKLEGRKQEGTSKLQAHLPHKPSDQDWRESSDPSW